MVKITIPHTDMTCSTLCFGPATAGTLIDDDTMFEMLDIYAEMGGTMLDTAHVYADWIGKGKALSEKTIGRWLTASGMHGKMKIATKGGHYRFETPHISRITPDELAVDIQEGLEYLQIDRIDLYWMHRDNLDLPAGELVEFFNEQIKEGYIKAYGGSNWNNQRVMQAVEYAEAHGLIPMSGVQNMWSLADRNYSPSDSSMVACTKNQIDFYREQNIALWAYSSQAQGFFTRLDEGGQSALSEALIREYHSESNLKKLERIKVVANRHRTSVQAICLAYMYSQAFPCVAIFNTGRKEHLKEIMKSGELRLAKEDVDFLEGN